MGKLEGELREFKVRGSSLLIQKGCQQKAFSRMLRCDWLMLQHQPITTKHSVTKRFVKTFWFHNADPSPCNCLVVYNVIFDGDITRSNCDTITSKQPCRDILIMLLR